MGKLIKLLFRTLFWSFFYFCIASVVAQLIVFGVLSSKSAFDDDKPLRVLALLYNVDVEALRLELEEADQTQRIDPEAESSKTRKTATLITRDESFQNSLSDLVALQNLIHNEQDRHEILKKDFDNLLSQMEKEASENNVVELRRTLEILNPKQAKTQISRMIDDGGIEDVAVIIGAMTQTSRGKILREFKTRDEEKQRHKIIQELARQAEVADAETEAPP